MTLQFIMIVPVLLGAMAAAGLLVWWERRLLGFWQDRLGPNRVGPFGVLQIVADVAETLHETRLGAAVLRPRDLHARPDRGRRRHVDGFCRGAVRPGLFIIDLNIGLLFFVAMTSLAVYSVLLGGLASNSKYSLLGGMRSAAQMVTYEVFMALSLMGVVMMSGSFNLSAIVNAQKDLWFCIPQALGLVIFIIAGVAETHRLPFDLPEAEHELAAGFHTEYSGMKFGLIMVGEYLSLILTSAMIVTLFFGGWIGWAFLPPIVWFTIKTTIVINFFVLLRASIPRPRYDQLMSLGWKILLPLTLVNLLVTGAILLMKGGAHV